MTVFLSEPGVTLHVDDAVRALGALPDSIVDCVITSPPYWNLRDYDHADQIGLERSPEEYVDRLVEVFRECRRVLVPWGSLWLNVGDSYASKARGSDAGWKKSRLMRCSCPPTGWPDPDCPKHGLLPDQPFPPMDRHALNGEDARRAQRRLYLESLGRMECEECGRVGTRGFEAVRRPEEVSAGRHDCRWRCSARPACAARSRSRDRLSPRGRARLVAQAIANLRPRFQDEDELQAKVAAALAPRWDVIREHPVEGGRLDVWVPALRVAVEVKIAGSAAEARRQVRRYLALPEVDAVVLVTTRSSHIRLGALKPPTGKFVGVVYLSWGGL